MPPENLKEIRAIQHQERSLTALFVICLIASPVVPSLMMKNQSPSLVPLLIGLFFVAIAFWAQYKRAQMARQLLATFDNLSVGAKLEKKLTRNTPQQFLIVDKTPGHFNLRCVQTGESILVSKGRVREDFEIAN